MSSQLYVTIYLYWRVPQDCDVNVISFGAKNGGKMAHYTYN